MSRRPLLLLGSLALMLGACEGRGGVGTELAENAPTSAKGGGDGIADGKAGRTVSSITGEWRVAGANDEALNQSFGMAASIDEREIRIESQCVVMIWSYRLDDGVIVTMPPATPPEVCQRERTPDELAVERAMAGANRVERLPSQALLFSGPGGSVSMFTQ